MLTTIELENFRNHKDFRLELSPVTAIIGKNGVGKSNILEAIYLVSACRSFREDDRRNLVMIGNDFARIKADELEIFIQNAPTFLLRAKENGAFRKQSDFIGTKKSVIFSPEMILLINGSPRLRRRFLDIMISQSERHYLKEVMAFEKVRAERNSLLQKIFEHRAQTDELDFWNKEFISLGQSIVEARLLAIKKLNKRLSSLYRSVSGNPKDKLQIEYENSAPEGLEEAIKQNIWREIRSKRSLFGPHRDDLVFNLNDKPMASFASRGECRSAILALKIAELEFLTDENDKPMLLLDDLFSEFDLDRRSHLSKLIENYQTVLTTTDSSYLVDIKECKVVEL
ncbi:MAG: DNA replication and repair protein RecF [Patescibacteria group bacterium]|jgi:DNA replication and repair protein RecF